MARKYPPDSESERWCKRCERFKPLTDFYFNQTKKYRLRTCRRCHGKQAWTEQRARNAERGEYTPGHVNAQLRYRYGIDLGEYERMLTAQGGGCAVCGGTNDNGQSLSIDHDHRCCQGQRSCGKCVRGLLCARCNTGIGMFNDNPDLLARAIGYLRR